MSYRLNEDDFLFLFVEKNSDGTKNLRLKGRELQWRIGKRLVGDDMKRIARFLKDNPAITKLDISYNNIGDDGMHYLVNGYLKEENDLEYLDISGCTLTSTALSTLCKAMDTLELKVLRLHSNELGANAGRYLASLLENLNTLKYLDIGDANLNFFSVSGVLTRVTTSSLTVLDISRVLPRNSYATTNSYELAINVSDVLAYNTTLIELHMQKNEMDGHDVELLLYGLGRNENLQLLDLSYNKFGDHGLELISNWLKTRPNLLGLMVAGNGIKDAGARILSFAMPSSKIRFLDITHNKIGDKGMMNILYSIKKPYQLDIFYFWGNQFGHTTNKVIKRMLASKILRQEHIDIKLYTVDKVLYHAYYPTNHYKHRYYGVMDYGCAPELKIIKYFIPPEDAKPRALVDFVHLDRYPPAEKPPKKQDSDDYFLSLGEGDEDDCRCLFMDPLTMEPVHDDYYGAGGYSFSSTETATTSPTQPASAKTD